MSTKNNLHWNKILWVTCKAINMGIDDCMLTIIARHSYMLSLITKYQLVCEFVKYSLVHLLSTCSHRVYPGGHVYFNDYPGIQILCNFCHQWYHCSHVSFAHTRGKRWCESFV